MEPTYYRKYILEATEVNSADRLKNSRLLAIIQEVAGEHSALLGTDRDALESKRLFWAVIRHRVQITRLPRSGETIHVHTWPMPTTRTAYPRATVAYDQENRELFRTNPRTEDILEVTRRWEDVRARNLLTVATDQLVLGHNGYCIVEDE